MDDVGILLSGVDASPVVADVVVGVAFSGPLSVIRLFGTESLNWGPCCLVLFRAPQCRSNS